MAIGTVTAYEGYTVRITRGLYGSAFDSEPTWFEFEFISAPLGKGIAPLEALQAAY